MKPALLVLAAGLGSRYGGLKQLERFGPSGETIIDYSLYDARLGGFDRAVFVIRRDMEDDFRRVFLSDRSRFGEMKIDYCFQDPDDLPAGFEHLSAERTKPWGTAHAVWAAREFLKTAPFAVINGDDFYGRRAMVNIGAFLAGLPSHSANKYCMVGYKLSDTLSDFGSVSRGVCEVKAGKLVSVREVLGIHVENGSIAAETSLSLSSGDIVSMNLWGFTPSIFEFISKLFKIFLSACVSGCGREFYIPAAVNDIIGAKLADVAVLSADCGTDSRWFGVTYSEDRKFVADSIASMVSGGIYPDPLW